MQVNPVVGNSGRRDRLVIIPAGSRVKLVAHAVRVLIKKLARVRRIEIFDQLLDKILARKRIHINVVAVMRSCIGTESVWREHRVLKILIKPRHIGNLRMGGILGTLKHDRLHS